MDDCSGCVMDKNDNRTRIKTGPQPESESDVNIVVEAPVDIELTIEG